MPKGLVAYCTDPVFQDFTGGSDGKESAFNARNPVVRSQPYGTSVSLNQTQLLKTANDKSETVLFVRVSGLEAEEMPTQYVFVL